MGVNIKNRTLNNLCLKKLTKYPSLLRNSKWLYKKNLLSYNLGGGGKGGGIGGNSFEQ